MRLARLLGWALAGCLVAPLVYAGWISFSPGSFLTPPASAWSLRWYESFLADRRWTAALGRSAVVAVGSTLVALSAGIPLALTLVRDTFRGKHFLAGAVLLPTCVPPAVLGMGLLPVLFAVGLWGNLLGLILVHGLLALPVVYLIVRLRLEEVGSDLELAARGLGATPWQTFARVTLPLIRPALLAGAAASFAISINESLLTVFLATPTTETLPAVVWPQLRHAPSPLVAVASCASVLVALVVSGVLLLGQRRR